ncbi:MAG TPA: hypothetical protein VMW08_11050 [Acidimicrobiales bacterium]|nr:hypothetical protein [Acidimicrobiales bacterium]
MTKSTGKRSVDPERFWEAVEPFLAEDGVEEGTLMGFACIRVHGEFFAMPKHDTGQLVCKLAAERVAELVAEGTGEPFGPGNKVFKEWVLIDFAHEDRWHDLAGEAKAFVSD